MAFATAGPEDDECHAAQHCDRNREAEHDACVHTGRIPVRSDDMQPSIKICCDVSATSKQASKQARKQASETGKYSLVEIHEGVVPVTARVGTMEHIRNQDEANTDTLTRDRSNSQSRQSLSASRSPTSRFCTIRAAHNEPISPTKTLSKP